MICTMIATKFTMQLKVDKHMFYIDGGQDLHIISSRRHKEFKSDNDSPYKNVSHTNIQLQSYTTHGKFSI